MPRLKALKAYQPSVASTPQATTTKPQRISCIEADSAGGCVASAENTETATATHPLSVLRHMNAAFFAKLAVCSGMGAAYLGVGAAGYAALMVGAVAIVAAVSALTAQARPATTEQEIRDAA